MANQVYFPHYKQIFDADPAAFILISHPETGLAYKIRVDALQEALTSSLISSDTPNVLTLGTDGLLLVDPTNLISTDVGNIIKLGTDNLLMAVNLYTDDGTLLGDRIVDADAHDFTIVDAVNVDIYASTHIVLTSTSGDDVGVVAALPTSAAMQVTDGVSTSTISATAENVSLLPDVKLFVGDGVGGVVGDVLELVNSTTFECAWTTQRKNYVGTGTLVNGTVAIADANVSAGCVIQVTPTDLNATVASGVLRVTSRTNGVGFTVTSINPGATTTAATDESSFDYVIIK